MSARYTGGLVYNAPAGWSAQFNGSNYLRVTSATALTLGSGNFCIEMWLFPTAAGSNPLIWGEGPDVGSNNMNIHYNISGNGTIQVYIDAFSGSSVMQSSAISQNTWTHVAVTRSGSTFRLFINGNQSSTYSNAGSVNSGDLRIGASYVGYISNSRTIKGSAIYTANFAPPVGQLQAVSGTSLLTCAYPTIVDGSTNAFSITNNSSVAVSTLNPFPTSQLPNPALGGAGNGVYTMSQYAALKAANLWPAYDPYYKNVTLNLHGNAGAVLPFNTDASTNNFQVTQVGNTSPSNYTPFITNGYWSNYFNGSSYLQVAYNSALDASTGPFTYECWLNPSTTTNKQYLGGSVTNAFFAFVGSGTIFVGRNNVAVDFTSSTGINTNQWNHVVIVRNSSNNIAIFINGVSAYYNASNTNNYGLASNPLRIGVATTGSSYEYNGYISNVRIAKSALYDPTASTITVPTAPLTAGSAGLLTCQSNRFVDNSSNAFALTTSGSPAINPLQPFTAPTGTSAYGSGYFDGSGDSLTSSNNSAFNLGSNNFTVEAWVYVTATPGGSGAVIIGKNSATYPGGYEFNFVVDTGRTIFFGAYTTTLVSLQGAIVTSLNSWNHVAAVRSGSNWALFVNGVRDVTATSSGTVQTTSSSLYVGDYGGGSRNLTGYISNVRLVNGSAVYDPTVSTLTIPTSPLTAITNTSLLTVQTNAPSQNNTFLDSSTNNFVITRNGNTTQGTFTPYGSNWSCYLDGSGDQLTTPSQASFRIDQGNWTWEGWVFPTSLRNSNVLISLGTGGSNVWYTITVGLADGSILFGTNNGTWNFIGVYSSSANVIKVNQWNHFALVYSGTTLYFFANGVAAGSQASPYLAPGQSGTLYMGSYYNNYNNDGSWYGGYVSNLRFVQGTAVYSGSTYTVPTAPLTAITNTSLLAFQSNRFIDTSANAYALTRVGDTSIQRFSPFSPTTAYSTSVIGGSGYFDGSGDYLSTPSSAGFAFGTGDFTVEAWIYPNTVSGERGFFQSSATAGGLQTSYTNGIVMVVGISTTLDVNIGGTNISSSVTIKPSTWTHVAITRSSGSVRLFVNGALVGGPTTITANLTGTYACIGGYYSTSYLWNGYVNDLRVVNGTAVYTSAFTPPTAPLTAITNTQLLTNFTNAGILDNAMMNDLETVGNAQISTSVKKYGTGSMYFDGSGDYLLSPNVASNGLGNGNFTVEFWVYVSAYLDGDTPLCIGTFGTWYPNIMVRMNPNWTISVGNGSSWVFVDQGFGTKAIGSWAHIAITRSSGTLRAFLNGVQGYSVSNSTDMTLQQVVVGNTTAYSLYFNGYIDDLRITKGYARYTANFTPPTAAFPNIGPT